MISFPCDIYEKRNKFRKAHPPTTPPNNDAYEPSFQKSWIRPRYIDYPHYMYFTTSPSPFLSLHAILKKMHEIVKHLPTNQSVYFYTTSVVCW